MSRAYDALVLDIDGTLLDDAEHLSPRTAAALEHARAQGVQVMLATGRSHHGVRPIAAALQLELPSIVFNGAAAYDLLKDQLFNCYHLPEALVGSLIAHARTQGQVSVVARAEGQYVRAASPEEEPMLSGFVHLTQLPESKLPRAEVLRVTVFSRFHSESSALYAELKPVLGGYPAYCTHFALAALAGFRESQAHVVDVQPDCAGKAEALKLLAQRFAISPDRVVAVGDAGNDVPLLRAVGLGVAMGNAPAEVKRNAKRVIGDNNSGALAGLIEELFA